MALSVTVSDDTRPDDVVFEIVGLGAFKNGEATEVSEEAERAYVCANQMGVEDRIGPSDVIKISGSTSIDNMEEVLGTDISDVPASPEESILNNPSVSDDDPMKKQMQEVQDAETETPAAPQTPNASSPDTTPTSPDTGGES